MYVRRWVFGLALLVCVALLGRWAMLPNDAATELVRERAPIAADRTPSRLQVGTIPADDSDAKQSANESFALLRGRVVDAATRQPVRDFQLAFWATHGLRPGMQQPAPQTFQTADGTFETRLPVGVWTITASARDYQQFDLRGLALPDAKTARQILVPLRPGHTIQGRVYDEDSGLGVGDATISVREAHIERFGGSWRSRTRVQTQPDGSFVLDGVPSGRVTLTVEALTHAEREVDIVVSDATPPVEIALLSGGRIAGRLTQADGVTPITGNIGLFNVDEGFGGSHNTNESGEFFYEHLRAGRYQLTGRAEGVTASREITLAENEKLENIVLALGAGPSIRGRVTGLAPADLEQVNISMLHYGAIGADGRQARADARGEFVLHGVAPGRVQVVADLPKRRHVQKTIVMPADADIAVELHFAPGAKLFGRITRRGKPLAGARVAPRALVMHDSSVYGTVTSPDGRYALEDLPPGEYALAVGDVYRSRAIDVSGETEFDIDIPDTQVAGTVLEESGKVPIVDAQVSLWPAEPTGRSAHLQDNSNHYGKFTFVGLDSGRYILNVYKPGYDMYREEISHDASIGDIPVRLRRAEGVRIQVRDRRSGEPLPLINANELIGGDFNATRLNIYLDENGTGYLPSALAGSTLAFWAYGYSPALVEAWNGQSLDLQLIRDAQQ